MITGNSRPTISVQREVNRDMRKIRLCRIIYEFAPSIGGSITHTIELAEHMDPYCERQFLVVPVVKEDTSKLDASFPFEVQRVKYCEFKILQNIKTRFLRRLPVARMMAFSFSFAAMRQCLKLNKQYNIDIVHAHGIHLGFALWIFKKITRKPTILMLHGSTQDINKISGLIEIVVTRFFRPKHLLVLDDGTGATEKFDNLVKKGVASIVYHAIDTNKFIPKEPDKNMIIQHGLKDTFVILYVSRLENWKNPDYALKTFHRFLSFCGSNPPVTLLIIGDGVLKEALETLALDLRLTGNVKFLGNVNNELIPNYMSISDVIITTSLVSNMSRSIQEAMACAKAVVTFSSGGTSKAVIDEETGLLAKPGDIEGLANQLLRLYKNPELREKLGKNARQFIIRERSWETRINHELGIYQTVNPGLRDGAV